MIEEAINRIVIRLIREAEADQESGRPALR